MSRLINPGPGDFADRLTILALKIHHGALAGKDTTHFTNERAVLLTKIQAGNGLAGWVGELVDLGAVNAALWDLTDDLRTIKEWTPPASDPNESIVTITQTTNLIEAGKIGLRLLSLNDTRAALVAAINQKTGAHLGQEKL